METETLRKCVEALNSLGQNATVILQWVKGQADHEGNEYADRLAKDRAELEPSDQEEQTETPKSYFKGIIGEGLNQQWNKEWQEEVTCRQSKLFMPTVDPGISNTILKLDRRELSLIIQALTGHCFLRYHQFNCRKTDSPLCRLCGEENEDSWHILMTCSALAKARQESVYWTTTTYPPAWMRY